MQHGGVLEFYVRPLPDDYPDVRVLSQCPLSFTNLPLLVAMSPPCHQSFTKATNGYHFMFHDQTIEAGELSLCTGRAFVLGDKKSMILRLTIIREHVRRARSPFDILMR